MSRYTIEKCLARAEAADGDDGDLDRVIREHDEAGAANTESGRIARGFVVIAETRRRHDKWRADAYRRLAAGEELPDEGDRAWALEVVLGDIRRRGLTRALRNEIDILLGPPKEETHAAVPRAHGPGRPLSGDHNG